MKILPNRIGNNDAQMNWNPGRRTRLLVLGTCAIFSSGFAAATPILCPESTVELESKSQSSGCHVDLRPVTKDDLPAVFVMTARTKINSSEPTIPDAMGQSGKVFVGPKGTGVRSASCSGNKGISGSGNDQDEELIFTLDAPIPAEWIVFNLTKLNFSSDKPVLFVSSANSTGFDFVILEQELKEALEYTGPNQGDIPLGDLPTLPAQLMIDAFKVRVVQGHNFISEVRIISQCDDQNPCTEDQCTDNGCTFVPRPQGTPCGDPSDTDCTDPDSCDREGTCLSHDVPDATPCFDGMMCSENVVCAAGMCGSDDCGQFVGGCTDNEWSCSDNWSLGGAYPDNNGPVTYHVVLDGLDDVFLDVDILIDSLGIRDQAKLHVIQTGDMGDLTIVHPGGLILENKLFAGIGRVIDLTSGPLQVRGRGTYSAPPELAAPNRAGSSAVLSLDTGRSQDPLLLETVGQQEASGITPQGQGRVPAAIVSVPGTSRALAVCGNLVCEPGETACNCTSDFCGACLDVPDTVFSNCDPCPPGMCPEDECGVFLSGTMAFNVSGNLIMDGTNACPCDATTTNCGTGGLRGGVLPPPKFSAVDLSRAGVTGNFSMLRSVGFIHSTSFPLDLGGSFDNQSTVPQCFDWTLGGVQLTNGGPVPAPTFEVAGRDLGPIDAGFGNALDSNFSMGSMTIAAGAVVRFTNESVNVAAAGPCEEALYVRNLTLEPGAIVTLDHCKVYYDTLINNGATVVPMGCGALIEIAPCALYSDCLDGNGCTIDGCNAGTGSCSHVPIPSLEFGDTDHTGVLDSDDILCVLSAFRNILTESCPLERADLLPCGTPTCSTSSDCQTAATGTLCLVNNRCGCESDFDCLGGTCDNGRCRLMDVDDILAILNAFVGLPGLTCPPPCPS